MSENINKIKLTLENYFSKLVFDEKNHKYFVNNKGLKSVSHFLESFYEKFDADKISEIVANKRGITKEEVLQEWEDIKNKACSQGTLAHLFGETFQKTGKKPSNGFEEAIVKFWNNLPTHIIVVKFELQMYSETYGIAGTADIILYNTLTGKFILADYKTNRDLFKNFASKKLLYPFNFLLDNPYNKYQLQLSSYQILFELVGYEIESRRIIWIKPDGNYEMFKTVDYTERLKQYLLNLK